MAQTTHVLTLLDPCPMTGRPCEVAQALLEALAAAMSGACGVIGRDFSLTGTVETRACGRVCRLHWSGSDRSLSVEAVSSAPGRGPRLAAERRGGRLS